MPDQPFTVHVDPDELTRRQLATAVSLPDTGTGTPGQEPAAGDPGAHHGARDTRMAARERSGHDRAGRAGGGSTRSYAFRRS